MVDVAGQTQSAKVASTIRSAKYAGGSKASPEPGSTISYYVDPVSGRKTYRVGGESPKGRYTQVTEAEYKATSVGNVPSQVVSRYKESIGPVTPKEQFTIEGAMGEQYAKTHASIREAQTTRPTQVTERQLTTIRETALQRELTREPSSYEIDSQKKQPIQETTPYTQQLVYEDTQIPKGTFNSQYILKKTFPTYKKETYSDKYSTDSKFTPGGMISAAKIDTYSEKGVKWQARVAEEYSRTELKESPFLLKPIYATKAFALSATRTIVEMAADPGKTAFRYYTFGKTLVTSPRKIGYSLAGELVKDPLKLSGELAGQYLFFKGIETTTKFTIDVGKSTYIKAGSEYIPPENIFSTKVLEGKQTMPLSKSIKETISKFEATYTPEGYVVSTASPSSIKGEFAGVGKKASLGLEDPGIYVTPAGEGSPYFLRLGGDIPTEYSFALNPFEGKFDVPTVTEFKVAEISRYPRSVIKKPGFESIAKYQEQVAGTGKVIITKRSEIGLGEITPKTFKSPSGKTLIEPGTVELEGVIPKGEPLYASPLKTTLGKIKGFEKYTVFEGKPVAIREGYVGAGATTKLSPSLSKISPSKIVTETKAVSSIVSRTKYISPKPIVPISYITSQSKQIQYPSYKMNGFSSSVSSISNISSTLSSISSSKSKYSSTTSRPYSTTSYLSSVSSKLSSKSSKTSTTSRPVSSISRAYSSASKRYSYKYPSYGYSGGGSSGKLTEPPEYPLSFAFRQTKTKKIIFPQKKKKIKGVRGYTPTLYATIGNIKATKSLNQLKKSKFTGLEVRGIK